VLVIVSTSIAHGAKQGLQTVAGTSSAMAIQLVVIAVSTTWFVRLITNGLFYLKWLGVAYLLYLGIYHLKTAIRSKQQETELSPSASFVKGFLVSLINPKTLLFFSAFLPQFVSATGNYNFQIFLLSFSFLLMATILDACYALLSSKLTLLVNNRQLNYFQNTFSSVLYLIASTWLAATNRTS